MQKRNKKKMVIGILCCMLVFMGIGYAALSQTLNIGTTAKVTGSWNIYISSATVKEQSDADMNGTEIRDNKTTDISLNVSFKKPSDYITYDITVENAGTIDAKLDEITMTPPSNVIDGTEEKMFLMETKNLTKGSVLKAGETATFQMTLRFNEKATTLPSADEEFTFELKLNYVQSDSTKADTSGTGGGTIPAEVPDFTVDSNGRVVAYNESKITTDADGYLIVPEKNSEGKEIKIISNYSFSSVKPNVFALVNEDSYFIEAETEEEYLNIKTELEKIVSTDNQYTIYWTKNNSVPDDKIMGFYLDLKTKSFDSLKSNFSKIDLTNSTKVSKIDSMAFYESNISNIKLNDGLTYINNSAFSECTNLKEITIPSSVIEIKDSAFFNSGLINVIFDGTNDNTSKLLKIGESAFSDNNITSVVLPKSVTTISYEAFNNNPNLATITIKRANSDGMALSDKWNGNATVVYDPS